MSGLMKQNCNGTSTPMEEIERRIELAIFLKVYVRALYHCFVSAHTFPFLLKLKVVAYDFGIKHNILRRSASCACKITVVPSTWPAAETLKPNPDGVLFSNGSGDPSAVPYAVETVNEVLGKVPVFGICMGPQLLGQALGGKTLKMKFGHHEGNYPVRNIHNGHVEISAQECFK